MSVSERPVRSPPIGAQPVAAATRSEAPSSALESLFADAFAVEQLTEPESAIPICALRWFLNSYVAGLPGDVAEQFRKPRVEDWMAPAYEYLDRDFVTKLRARTSIELACGCILARTKRAE